MPSKQQDAIALLKSQHKEVKGLFGQADELSERALKQLKKIGDQICEQLIMHAQLEEQIFYPAVKEAAGRRHKEERDMVLESLEEHAVAKKVIGDLQEIDGSDESYRPKLKVLRELVEQHIKEEERELFPGARELLDEEQLRDLGARMAALMEGRGEEAASASRGEAEPQEF